MSKNLTEDAVMDLARDIFGLKDSDTALAGVGQLTTFNQLDAYKKKKRYGM